MCSLKIVVFICVMLSGFFKTHICNPQIYFGEEEITTSTKNNNAKSICIPVYECKTFHHIFDKIMAGNDTDWRLRLFACELDKDDGVYRGNIHLFIHYLYYNN